MDPILRLRRVTRHGDWIPEIDGLRALAIGMVVLCHVLGETELAGSPTLALEAHASLLAHLLRNGLMGVPLFFVISGFVLGLPFARQFLAGARPVSLMAYYLRRLTRIEPPYVAGVLLACLLAGYPVHAVAPQFASHIAATLAYLHIPVFGEVSWVNPTLWSLEVEVQFYLLAPLLMQCFRVRETGRRRVFFLVFLVLAGVVQAMAPHPVRFTLSVLYFVQYFAAGLLVADIFVLSPTRLAGRWAWDLAGIAALLAVLWPNQTAWAHAWFPFPLMVLVLAAMRGRTLRALCANRWVAVTGGMCYSIYLVHLPVMDALHGLTRRTLSAALGWLGNTVVQSFVLGIPVLLAGVALYLAVERPCMDPQWPAKLWRRVASGRG